MCTHNYLIRFTALFTHVLALIHSCVCQLFLESMLIYEGHRIVQQVSPGVWVQFVSIIKPFLRTTKSACLKKMAAFWTSQIRYKWKRFRKLSDVVPKNWQLTVICYPLNRISSWREIISPLLKSFWRENTPLKWSRSWNLRPRMYLVVFVRSLSRKNPIKFESFFILPFYLFGNVSSHAIATSGLI